MDWRMWLRKQHEQENYEAFGTGVFVEDIFLLQHDNHVIISRDFKRHICDSQTEIA